MESFKLECMILHSNKYEYFVENLDPKSQKEILLTSLKRIKYLEEAKKQIESYWQNPHFMDDIKSFDEKSYKRIFLYTQDVIASPNKIVELKHDLLYYVNNYYGNAHSLPYQKESICKFVCDAFEKLTLQKTNVSKIDLLNLFIQKETLSEIGIYFKGTNLKNTIYDFFKLELNEKRDYQAKLNEIIERKNKCLRECFENEVFKKILVLSKSDPINEIYQIELNHVKSSADLELQQRHLNSKEVNDYIELLIQLTNSFKRNCEKIFEEVRKYVEKCGRNLRNSNKEDFEDNCDDFTCEIIFEIKEKMWNATFSYENIKSFVYAVAKTKWVSKFNIDKIYEPNKKSLEYDSEQTHQMESSSVEIHEEAVNFWKLFESFKRRSIIKEKKIDIKKVNREVLYFAEKYDGHRKKSKSINTALTYLEDLGDYEKVVKRLYGDYDVSLYTNARHNKSEGQQKLETQEKLDGGEDAKCRITKLFEEVKNVSQLNKYYDTKADEEYDKMKSQR